MGLLQVEKLKKKNAIVEFVTKAITALDDKFKAVDVYLYFKNTFNFLASKISYERH